MGLTAVLGRRQRQKYGRENIYCLRDYLNHLNIRALNTLLVKVQKEMETGNLGKRILATWKKY